MSVAVGDVAGGGGGAERAGTPGPDPVHLRIVYLQQQENWTCLAIATENTFA